MNDSRRLIEWDWLETAFGTVLHFADVSDETADDITEWAAEGKITLACGQTATHVHIPGMFTRMGAKRCGRCCDALGYPRGQGSPKNDDACRPLVEARIA